MFSSMSKRLRGQNDSQDRCLDMFLIIHERDERCVECFRTLLAMPSKLLLEYSRCLRHKYSSTRNAFEITRDAFVISTRILVMLPSKRVLEYSRCLRHEYSSTRNAFVSTRDHAFEITTRLLVSDAFEVTCDAFEITSGVRSMFTTNSFLFTKHV
jgi:hypothetical protein